ncbi:threonine--tRNA ligase, partial [bacterium]|nr:threonine--tRNA ligase [bacterium]
NDPGNFLDLCRGGHAEDPKASLKHFKLLKVAGAYWRGDKDKKMLTRIYGTAFATAEELEEYVHLQEEAKKRDHRKLGQQLDLFTFSPLVGAGLPLFTPRGTAIRDELSKLLTELQGVAGYAKTDIPHLAKPELYKTSGHWDKFGDSLFHVKGKGDEPFVVKPMNCPHHTQIFASRSRSYRDLPIRFAEITKVYRDEQAGELLGLARVRSITQDDAHVFCTPDQVGQEIATAMGIIHDFYQPFDFELTVRLSLSDSANPDAYLGTPEIWKSAESSLRDALNEHGVEFVEEEGEAAFYGPKIDYTATDSLKRRWQLATVQLDLNMPERFELKYTDGDGNPQTPIMIHRAISGAQERFIAVLLEHYNGHLPLWLSPTQVIVLPISDEQLPYAQSVAEQFTAAGVRAEVDQRTESIGKKIRNAELMRHPVMLIVGKKEVDADTVAVRDQDGDQGSKKTATVVADLAKQIAERI